MEVFNNKALEKIIKELQDFINKSHSYSELINFLDEKFKFILQDSINDKIEKSEYNAMLDLFDHLKNHFKSMNQDGLVFTSTGFSINLRFNYFLEIRKFGKSIHRIKELK